MVLVHCEGWISCLGSAVVYCIWNNNIRLFSMQFWVLWAVSFSIGFALALLPPNSWLRGNNYAVEIIQAIILTNPISNQFHNLCGEKKAVLNFHWTPSCWISAHASYRIIFPYSTPTQRQPSPQTTVMVRATVKSTFLQKCHRVIFPAPKLVEREQTEPLHSVAFLHLVTTAHFVFENDITWNIWIVMGWDLYFLVCVWSGDKDLFSNSSSAAQVWDNCSNSIFFEVSSCSFGGRTDGP